MAAPRASLATPAPIPAPATTSAAATAPASIPPTPTPTASSGDPARARRLGLFGSAALAVLGLDILSKILVVAQLEPGRPRRVLGGAVYFVLARNSGAAFSLGTGATIVLTAIAVVIVVVIVRVARRLRSLGWAVSLGLVLGGALGNLVDRLFRAPGFGRGHVVDWISLFADDGHVWPIFNVADSAIVCGGVLAGTLAVLGIELDGRRGSTRDRTGRRSA